MSMRVSSSSVMSSCIRMGVEKQADFQAHFMPFLCQMGSDGSGCVCAFDLVPSASGVV